MKKIFATLTACALALAVGGTTFAQCRKDGCCDNCSQGGQFNQIKPGSAIAGEPDIYRQFRQNTIDLRQEMMNKRFDLQRENLMATPDAARIAGIKADITAIQAKISQIRIQSGLPEDGKRDGECFKMAGGCGKQNGMGDCNGQPCWQK
jgi:hypothetical protein